MDTSQQAAVTSRDREGSVAAQRQRRSIAEKRRIVEETLVPGASVAKVARAHGVNANQVFGWRRLYLAGRLGEQKPGIKLLPVRVSESKLAPVVVEPRVTDFSQPQPGTIHIEFRQAQCGLRGASIRYWCEFCWSVCGHDRIAGEDTDLDRGGGTDLRRGFTGLSAQVQTKLEQSPFSGHVFVFRGRRDDLIKVLWYDGDGLCLFAKRLERGRFVWPQATSGTFSLTRAQLSMLLEGIDWRRPERTWEPQLSV